MKITLNSELELSRVRYALCELASRRAEQSLDRTDPNLGRESRELRDLAERIDKEGKQQLEPTHTGN